MAASRSAPDPYQSARDLPSIAEMLQLIQGGKLLTRVIARKQRPELVKLEAQVHEMTKVIDDFYDLLGPRHWIFHESLHLDKMKALLPLLPAEAERKLIEFYRDPEQLAFLVGRLNHFPQLRERNQLLERAQEDYLAGRYDSTTLILITVMDGFVNDIEVEQGRRGLHARDEAEMVAWDSVVGHHQGLTRAHRTFTKSFSKTSNEEIHELYRNGIVHGMLVNYNNDVVATKAWNRLFAVTDWATSREKQAVPTPPPATFRGLLDAVVEFGKSQKTREEAKRALDDWKPRTLTGDEDGFAEDAVHVMATAYLAAWQRKNYGAMAQLLWVHARSETASQSAGEVREQCEPFSLEGFLVKRLDFVAPAICEVDVELQLDGEVKPARLRWIREGEAGMGVAPNQPGEWRLVSWGPWAMLNNVKQERD